MECPVCGSETVTCSGYDDDDYTIWGECCTDEDCGWSNLYDQDDE